MTAPDLTLRVVMVSSDITDDIDDGLKLNAEPTVILQGSEDAVKAAAKLFGERVAITRPTPLADALAVPTDEPEDGEERAVIVKAKWKPCVHGGGWWVAQDADGCDVLLAPDGFAALRAIGEGRNE